MLTVGQVTEYADEFKRAGFIYVEDESPSTKLRLCYLRDNKLCRLAMISEDAGYNLFTDFVNQQEDLTEDMLIKSDVARQGKYFLDLGTYRINENGITRDIDVQANVKAISDTLIEASQVF